MKNLSIRMRFSGITMVMILYLFFWSSCSENKSSLPWIVTAPAGTRYTAIDKSGETIIPNGRIVTPVGKSITVAPHPYGLTLSPDGNTGLKSVVLLKVLIQKKTSIDTEFYPVGFSFPGVGRQPADHRIGEYADFKGLNHGRNGLGDCD